MLTGMNETYGTYVDDKCLDIHDYHGDTDHDTDDETDDDTDDDTNNDADVILMLVGAGTCPGTKKHTGILVYCNIAIAQT